MFYDASSLEKALVHIQLCSIVYFFFFHLILNDWSKSRIFLNSSTMHRYSFCEAIHRCMCSAFCWNILTSLCCVCFCSCSPRVGSSLPTWLFGLSLLTPIGYGGSILQENALAGLTLSGCETALLGCEGNMTTCNEITAMALANETACFATGDEYLDSILKPWQRNLGTNFAAFIGILLFFYLVTFVTFGIRRRMVHT